MSDVASALSIVRRGKKKKIGTKERKARGSVRSVETILDEFCNVLFDIKFSRGKTYESKSGDVSVRDIFTVDNAIPIKNSYKKKKNRYNTYAVIDTPYFKHR